MGAGSTAIIGTITSVGLLSLPLQGVAGFVTATLFAERDTKTPLAINFFGLLFFVLVGYYEIFGEGLTGLMYALTISFGCISLIGLFILQRKGLQVLQSISQIAFLVPLIIAIFVLVAGGMYIQTKSLGQTPTFLLTIGLGCVALLLFVTFNPSSRKLLQDVMPFKP
jgi:peptidoglycan biosynthesis protein MviN/MurJ (putative lipid II flippase)